MNQELYFTVFTPSYNRANLLGKLYASLCQQDFNSFEWIIVDDGSTDNTCELVKIFVVEDKIDIKYYRQQNQDKHVAINTGVSLARGKWFFIVDSDDYLTQDSLTVAYEYISSIEDNSQFAGVAGLRGMDANTPWLHWGTENQDSEKSKQILSQEYIDATALEYRYKYGIKGDRSEVIRTDIMRKHLFPVFEGEKFMSESVVWFELAHEGYKIRWFNKINYITEYHEDGLTKNIETVHSKSPKGIAYNSNLQLGYQELPVKLRLKACLVYGMSAAASGYSLIKTIHDCKWGILCLPAWLISEISIRRK